MVDANPDWEIDTYYHCWYDISRIGQRYDASSWNHKCNYTILPNTIDNLNELYQPIAYQFEPEHDIILKKPDEFYKNAHVLDSDIKRTFSQYLSIYKSYLVYENNKQCDYDIIIKTRFDVNFNQNLLLNNINNDKFYFAPLHLNQYNGDWLLISNDEYMKVYCMTYLYLDALFENNAKNVVEDLGEDNLKQHNIDIHHLPFKLNIIRE